ncbi:MAG TPA: protein kinase, partial [Kofleriaceae bacterium]
MDLDGTGDLPTPVLGGGRFEIRGTLGSGGAGVVYRAMDRELGREVALKWLRTASGRDLIRFKREFRALADIQHPNLIALHELHSSDGDWFFTMELVEGDAFIDWVRPSRVGSTGSKRSRADIANGAVNYARLRGALIQLVDALVALHRAGKLHRDLKPSNVLVTPHGRTALLDFGLVLQVSEGDPEHLAVGTPGYMSPEQAADQTLTEASDWYGVGCMLYEALVGRRPFEGEASDIMMRKQRETPAYPTELAPSTPPDLARLCAALLKPSPKERPTGEQILAQLGASPSKTTRKLARSSGPLVFVGRSSEVDDLRRALADARRRGATVIVKGRSGIGKSTLVRRFVRDLGDAVTALEGRCFEREAVPFKMLDGVVDALSSALVALTADQIESLVLDGRGRETIGSLARLFPVMRRVPLIADASTDHTVPADPAELRQRGFAALRGVLVRMARTKPVVIVVDDAHWGDADSCTFLAELIHGGDPGLLVVIATRPEDYRGVMAQLRRPPRGSLRRGDIRDVEIAPLAADDALALVAQLAPPGSAQAIVTAAEGNPLALVEMARAGELPAGTKMDDLVRVRTLRLSPHAQALLAVSSVAARPLPVAIAAYAAGISGGHDEAAVLVADRLATVRHADGTAMLHPAHDYVRTSVLAALGPESRAS